MHETKEKCRKKANKKHKNSIRTPYMNHLHAIIGETHMERGESECDAGTVQQKAKKIAEEC